MGSAWSLIDGCTPCSPGCEHCWSASITHRFKHPKSDSHIHDGLLTNDSGKFTGVIQTHPGRLDIPLRTREPTVFAVWNDLFHEDVPDEFRDKAYAVMALCPQHTFLVLTKRADKMADYWNYENEFINRRGKIQNIVDFKVVIDNLQKRNFLWPLLNVWHGLTVCNQPELDAKIGDFLRVPGKKWLSVEPMLGRIINPICNDKCDQGFGKNIIGPCCDCKNKVDLVVLGGETGPGARPMHPDWVRFVRDQCQEAGIPFFFKQWG